MKFTIKEMAAQLIAGLIAATILAAPAHAFEIPCWMQSGNACQGEDGADGADGKDGLNGRDADPSGLAIMAAMSNPIWLETNEAVAFSGGWGTFDGHHAIAGTIVFRLDQAWSVNGSLGTDFGRDAWAARAGLRAGW